MAQEPKLPAAAAFGVEHLKAHEVATQDRKGCIENLIVKRFYPAGVDQLCGDVMKPVGGVRLALPQTLVDLFHLASLLSPTRVKLRFHVA
jgi:hypothetical protein